MAKVDLRLMSINDFIDFQCSACLFMEFLDNKLCSLCIDEMKDDYFSFFNSKLYEIFSGLSC